MGHGKLCRFSNVQQHELCATVRIGVSVGPVSRRHLSEPRGQLDGCHVMNGREPPTNCRADEI
jgi:hypothetical protein